MARGWAHGPREAARLAVLRRHEVLERPVDEELRALVALAARVAGAPHASLHATPSRAHWLAAGAGPAEVATGDVEGLRVVASSPLLGAGGLVLGELRLHGDHAPAGDVGDVLDALARQAVALLELQARADALSAVTARYRVAFEHAPVGMALVDASGCWARVNPALSRMLGEDAASLLGTSLEDVVAEEDLDAVQAALGRLRRGDALEQHLEVRLLHRTGGLVWGAVWIAVGEAEHGDMVDLVVQIDDITERKAADAELVRRATHDPLTGLPNRLLLADRLATAMERLRRGEGEVTLMLLDLDGFKQVNDSRGHGAGDQLLVAIGERIRAGLRATDTVARLGGDEFVVLCEERSPTGEGARIAERFLALLGDPICVDGGPVSISASVGVVTVRERVEPDELLRRADVALYAAKAAGRNRVALR